MSAFSGVVLSQIDCLSVSILAFSKHFMYVGGSGSNCNQQDGGTSSHHKNSTRVVQWQFCKQRWMAFSDYLTFSYKLSKLKKYKVTNITHFKVFLEKYGMKCMPL